MASAFALRLTCVLVVVMGVLGCGSVQEEPDGPPVNPMIDASPMADAEVPFTCTADAFVECSDATTAQFCNATGDGLVPTDCRAPGCNATAGRCNECVPDAATCDAGALQQCDADGLIRSTTPCQLSCVDEVGGVPAHCAYISPTYLADICDAPATEPSFVVAASATLDTALDTNCNGGVVTQTAGPAICVLRYGTIAVNASRTLTITGPRAVALVADTALDVLGTIDASADGTTNGPGGGTMTSGAAAAGTNGGGGAGFKTAGANGGSATTNGAGGAGGAIVDPIALNSIIGGPRPAAPQLFDGAAGGGGGGSVNLIACRGTVTVSGLIDAGGGGGRGGFDVIIGAQIDVVPAGGGGAGGYVVIQGLDVSVTGQMFANGGGGGGGSTTNDTAGGAGGDGTRSATSVAAGGAPSGSGGAGGFGGRVGATPGIGGGGSSSPGGGGGATGRFQVYRPTGVTPTVTPSAASPAFEPHRIVTTR